jgi:hypothetical protein
MGKCQHCGREYEGPPGKQYCSRRCTNAASSMRCYWNDKTDDPERAERNAERRRRYAARWRRRNALEGRCSRCGHHNDRAEEGRLVCSACLATLKGARW